MCCANKFRSRTPTPQSSCLLSVCVSVAFLGCGWWAMTLLPPPLPPTLPGQPFGPMPHFDPVVVTDVYSGMMGAVGVLLLLFGQRAWRIFLYIIAFSAGGGTCGYLCVHNHRFAGMGRRSIACCVGFASAVVAHFFRMVGLVAIAALAGFILTAMPLRLFIPSLHAPYRLTFLGLGTALGALLTGIGLYQYRRSRAEADEPTAPIPTRHRWLAHCCARS